MYKFIPLALALVAPTAASAQSFFTQGSVITAQPGTYYENGLGSPSVAYLGTNSYVMFFETRLPASYISANGLSTAGCRNNALWAVGTAISSDGLSWTVSDDPLVVPETGTFYSCVAAHPSVHYDGSTVHLYFKGEQLASPCESTTPPWGCDRQVGVGVATFTFDAGSGSFGTIDEPSIALNVSGFGFPSVVRVGSTYQMFLAKVPSLYKATGGSFDNFSLNGSASISAGAVSWTPDRVFNPAAFCADASAYPYTIYLGGKDIDANGAVNEGGWGRTISPDTTEWYTASEASVSWVGADEWRHWDALRVKGAPESCDSGSANENILVYYSDKDANNRNQIGIAYTRNTIGSAPWNGADGTPQDKGCTVLGADADGYYEPAGDVFGDTGYNEAFSHHDEGAGSPAGCSTTGGAGGFALLLPFLMVRRRRS